jgi:hypothetical protein
MPPPGGKARAGSAGATEVTVPPRPDRRDQALGVDGRLRGLRLDFNAREPYTRFLQGLTTVDGLLGKVRLTRATNLNDLQVAHDKGQPTLVRSIEGAHFLEGRLERNGKGVGNVLSVLFLTLLPSFVVQRIPGLRLKRGYWFDFHNLLCIVK